MINLRKFIIKSFFFLCFIANYSLAEDEKNAAILYHLKKYELSLKYTLKACENNNFKSCYAAGGLYLMGKGIKKDYTKSYSFFKKACNGGIANGCYALAGLYLSGKGVNQNMNKAKEYLQIACSSDFKKACMQLNKIQNN